MRIRVSSKQAVVTVAAVALPLPLHQVGHKHHHTAATTPAHTRTTSGKTGAAGAPSNGTDQSNASGSNATIPQRATSRHRHHRPATGTHRSAHHHLRVPLALKAHSARDPGDTISDFKFSPGSLTIHVGDTVTWTNAGPSSHTATANNGSFNTGVLAKGASASHTFTSAGTFSYFCTIHPFMHGTIVVLASTTTSTPSTTPGTTTTTPTATTASGSGLPNTGLDLVATVVCGLALGGVGLALRRPGRALPQSQSGEGRTPRR
jgi:plastocyanin